MELTNEQATWPDWQRLYRLELAVSVGAELRVALTTHNTGDEAFTITDALHTYYKVSQVTDIAIHGLGGCRFVSLHGEESIQHGPLTISCEVDRVFVDTTGEYVIEDPGLRRRVRIRKEGSRSAVVWNPWTEIAASLPDFGDDEYTEMVCVETTNARPDPVTIEPGGSHCLAAIINSELM